MKVYDEGWGIRLNGLRRNSLWVDVHRSPVWGVVKEEKKCKMAEVKERIKPNEPETELR